MTCISWWTLRPGSPEDRLHEREFDDRGPGLVNAIRHRQRLRLGSSLALVRAGTQVEFQLLVDAVNALMVPLKTLHVAQMPVAKPEPPVPVFVRQPDQPLGYQQVLGVQLRAIAVGALAQPERLTG